MLEPCEGKLSRTVLRGESGSDAADLLDRPADLEQRHGRIQRQGNMFDKVHIYQYITEGTFDSYLFQTVELKQKYISQIMTNKSPARSCSDLDEVVLNYAEIKALATGDNRVRDVMELDNEIKKLSLEKQSFYSAQKRMREFIDSAPAKISSLESKIEKIKQDIKVYRPPSEFQMEVSGFFYEKRTEAGKSLANEISNAPLSEDKRIGTYAGLDIYVHKSINSPTSLFLKGEWSYSMESSFSELGNITRIENTTQKLDKYLENAEFDKLNLENELVNSQENVGKTFAKEELLKDKLAKKAELDFEIEMELKAGQQELESATVTSGDDYEL